MILGCVIVKGLFFSNCWWNNGIILLLFFSMLLKCIMVNIVLLGMVDCGVLFSSLKLIDLVVVRVCSISLVMCFDVFMMLVGCIVLFVEIKIKYLIVFFIVVCVMLSVLNMLLSIFFEGLYFISGICLYVVVW